MTAAPFFSICIPQHNRTSFIVEAVRSIARQQFRDCEICVSDDCSNDGREQEIHAALEASGLPFTFQRRSVNGRYDKNLRSAMDLAKGEYLLLLANDDALKDETTLERMAELLRAHPAADVMLTNFEDFGSGVVTRRVDRTAIVGFGPRAAVAAFRKFSFVSGIVLRRRQAGLARTDAWDGTEMYQMYVGCRMIASGGGLLEADLSTIRKDISVPGEGVDSFAAKAATGAARSSRAADSGQPRRGAGRVRDRAVPRVGPSTNASEPDGAVLRVSLPVLALRVPTCAVVAVRGRRGAGIHALEKSRRIPRAGAGAGRGVDLVRRVHRDRAYGAFRDIDLAVPAGAARRSCGREPWAAGRQGGTFVTAVRPILIVGNDGGTNIGASLLRAARALGIPADLADARSAYDAPRAVARFNWWVRGRRPTRLGGFSASVAERWRNERPSTVIAAGLVPLDARALE